MIGFRSFDNSTCDRVLLESGYLRLREIVGKALIVISFGMKDESGDGRGCFGTEVRANTAKMTNMIIAGFGKRLDDQSGLKR